MPPDAQSAPVPPLPPPHNTAPAPLPRSPLTFDDLAADLLWPKLLRVPRLALEPGRLTLGVIAVLLVALAEELLRLTVVVDAQGPLSKLGESIITTAGPRLGVSPGEGAWQAVFTVPAIVLAERPLSLPLALAAVAAVWCLLGVAVSRSAIVEFSTGARLSWPRALRFASDRLGSSLGALLGPLAIVWGIALFVWAVGQPMHAVTGLDVLAGLLFPVALVLGLIAAVMVFALSLGGLLLGPAVAADGADAFDAVQRAYAYALTKPLRLAFYLAVALVVGGLALGVVSEIAFVAQRLAVAMSGTPLADSTFAIDAVVPADASRSQAAAGRLARAWVYVLELGVYGYGASLLWTASGLVYLLIRQVCDGQDLGEIYIPGMLDATLSANMAPTEPAAGDAAPAPRSDHQGAPR
ncbi:MAG: hypothetical protein C0468_01960 [Planctomyces sp.]|nr:hypothetical protein [Planctomyces sp.]